MTKIYLTFKNIKWLPPKIINIQEKLNFRLENFSYDAHSHFK